MQRQTGAMQEACATYERALAIDRELGDGYAEAKALNSLAIVHAEQGRFDEARTAFRDRARDQPRAREIAGRKVSCSATSASLNIEQGRLANGTRAMRGRARGPSRHRRARSRRARRWPTSPCSTRQPVSRGRTEQFLARRWRSRAMRAIAASEGVVLGHARAPRDASKGRIERRPGCTTTRHSPSIATSAIVVAKAWCSRSSADLLARQGRDEEARALLAQGEAHLRAVGQTLDLVGLLCLRGRLEFAAGEPARALATLAEADSGARALGLDADSKLWKEIAALREAIGAGRSTAR